MAPKAISPPQATVLGMYSPAMVSPPGDIVVVAGQTAMDDRGSLVGPGDVVAQTKQVYENIRTVLAAAGCTMRDVVRFQTFLTQASDIEGFMQARREVFPRYYPDGAYPPNTLLVVSRLVRPELLVEIEAMAVKPGGRDGAGAPRAAVPRRRAPRLSGRRQPSKKRR
jgi:enamine deaminase RidA (YjgF/YER057c/UK114 family)